MDGGERIVRDEREPGPIGRVLIALMLAVFALFCLGVAFHWLNVEPSRGVPRALVGIVGAICALGSVMALLPRDSRASAVLAALAVTGFAAIGGWIAFGPGERHFGMSISFGAFLSDGNPGEWIGRTVFGLAALLCGLCAFAIWRYALRARPPADDRGTR